jgi:hypothetical protein
VTIPGLTDVESWLLVAAVVIWAVALVIPRFFDAAFRAADSAKVGDALADDAAAPWNGRA